MVDALFTPDPIDRTYKVTIAHPNGTTNAIHDTLRRIAEFYQLTPDEIIWAIEDAGQCDVEWEGKPVTIEEVILP